MQVRSTLMSEAQRKHDKRPNHTSAVFWGMCIVLMAACNGDSATTIDVAPQEDLDIVPFDLAGDVDRSEFVWETNPPADATVSELVLPLYPLNGASWNDYVLNDGSDRFSATDVACTGEEMGGYNACLHGGEMRVVEVGGYDSCEGLVAADALDAFDWVCNASTNPVTMVSIGLKKGKGLSDLLDFDAVWWRTNSVTVSDGETDVLATPSELWWDNPVVANNLGGRLDHEGGIYLVTEEATATFSIRTNRIALVVDPNVMLHGYDTHEATVGGVSARFLWVEGAVDAAGAEAGVDFGGVDGVRFSVMRDVHVMNAYWGVVLFNSSANNRLVNITVANNSIGLYMHFTRNNTIDGVSAFNNEENNIYVHRGCINNVLSNVTSFGSRNGIKIEGATDNVLINVTVANIGPTIARDGIYVFADSNNNIFANTAVTNSYGSGFHLDFSNWNFFENVASANNAWSGARTAAFRFNDSSYNYFTGVVLAGNSPTTDHCDVELPDTMDAGLTVARDGCATDGGSDAQVINGVTLANAFVGKVEGDTVNQHGATGTTTYDDIVDWTTFSTLYRGWGREGSAFPASDHMSRCSSEETCRIWDWALSLSDAVIRNVETELPTGDDTARHLWSASTEADCAGIPGSDWGPDLCSLPGLDRQGWCEALDGDWTSDKCSSVFLRNAVEVLDDRIGNENGLCESGETCLFTPNIGSYQGHGTVELAATIGLGTALEQIVLLRQIENGN